MEEGQHMDLWEISSLKREMTKLFVARSLASAIQAALSAPSVTQKLFDPAFRTE